MLYGLLIESLIQQRKFADAEKAAREAIKLEPDEALWSDLLGDAITYQGHGRKNEAGEAYQQAFNKEYVLADRHVYQGDIMKLNEQRNLAINEYREAVRLKPERGLLKVILAGILKGQAQNGFYKKLVEMQEVRQVTKTTTIIPRFAYFAASISANTQP